MFNLSSISKIVLKIPKNAGPVLALFLPTWYCKWGGGVLLLRKNKAEPVLEMQLLACNLESVHNEKS